MEEQEARRRFISSIPLVEFPDSLKSQFEQVLIAWLLIGQGVSPIGEESKKHISLRLCEKMNLEPLYVLFQAFARGEQRRYGNQRAAFLRNSIAQLEGGQKLCTQHLGNEKGDKGNGCL